MDIGKTVEAILAAGPGAGIGLAVGLLLFLGALVSQKVVMIGRFNDMKEQRDHYLIEQKTAEHDRDSIRQERDELRIMVAQSIVQARKNAALAGSMIIRRAREEEDPDNDGPQRPARLSRGR